jgi:hypothetical protein
MRYFSEPARASKKSNIVRRRYGGYFRDSIPYGVICITIHRLATHGARDEGYAIQAISRAILDLRLATIRFRAG